MNDKKQSNDATSSTQGTVYQFYVAVLKCFEMVAGQKVIIERYGDVTLGDQEQMELKLYNQPLTDSHLNFWKTLHNWMRDDFNEDSYEALVLYTDPSYVTGAVA